MGELWMKKEVGFELELAVYRGGLARLRDGD